VSVGLAHEYFSAHGGAERVVEVFHRMYPDAPVYTFFHDRRAYGPLPGYDLHTSFLQSVPLGGGAHRALLPLYPRAAAGLHVARGTELLLTSTSAFIKCLAVPDETVHLAYCHSPTRYLWDWSEQYLAEEVPAPLQGMVRSLLPGLREADLRGAKRVDHWIANSDVVRARIKRYYGRDSEVIHPPVDVDTFTPAAERGDFWVIVSRLSAYKRVDLAVKAFNEIGMRLIVVGDGRERRALEQLARDNVTFSGRVDDETVKQLLGSARGFIFPAEDDFGIVCVEALASGAPVVALGRGGATEIVRDGIDGALVADPDAALFVDAVHRVEQAALHPEELRRSARRFDVSRFESRIRASIDHARAEGRAS
jgi:glycosyltransferase involved in cell wall biosynthesis